MQPHQIHPMMDNQQNINMDGYEQVIQEKDNTITQLRETIEILELKIKKLEQLVKLKDSKIGNLTNKLNSMGILWLTDSFVININWTQLDINV